MGAGSGRAPHLGGAPYCWLWLKLEGLLGAGLGEKGLSVGVHIWEPLAHSYPLSACLRMDLDGTGREGLGGQFAPVDGNPDWSGRQPRASGREEAWGSFVPESSIGQNGPGSPGHSVQPTHLIHGLGCGWGLPQF